MKILCVSRPLVLKVPDLIHEKCLRVYYHTLSVRQIVNDIVEQFWKINATRFLVPG